MIYQDRPRSRFFQIADKSVAALTVIAFLTLVWGWGFYVGGSDARAAQMMQCPDTSQGE
jgi:hypothetical protein